MQLDRVGTAAFAWDGKLPLEVYAAAFFIFLYAKSTLYFSFLKSNLLVENIKETEA